MNNVLKEAERLYQLGFAILWIKPKSKAPVRSRWTTGPRETWDQLKSSFKPGFNVGVRLGTPSKLGLNYLAVFDIDVKSLDPKHRAQAENALKELFPSLPKNPVQVMSGRGNGSSHIYVVSQAPVSPMKVKVSTDKVKVLMPSATISQSQREQLTEEELNEGWRIRPAWEIAVMGDGQQVLLPPSTHPDSGKEYTWKRKLEAVSDLTTFDFSGNKKEKAERLATNDWTPVDVELFASSLPDDIVNLIIDADCDDRSAAIFKVVLAMVRAQMTDVEIMSVLTDVTYELGKVAYEHAKTESRARAANWLFNYTIKKARHEVDATYQFQEECVEIVLSEDEAKAQAEELVKSHDWKQLIERNISGQHAGRPKPTLKNLILILTNDVGGNVFVRDRFANRDSYGCHTPWGGRPGKEISDDDIVQVKEWFANRFRMEPNQNLIIETVIAIALKNSVHPVHDYLHSLMWDGTPRVDTWLKDFMKAKAPEPYLSDVSRKILLAMVARVFVPGIKFDYIPVLEGRQGIGKSSAAKILASPDWFADNIPDLRHPDARLNLQGKWVVEMGELASLKRSDLELIKSYVTSPVDRVRNPYGRRPYDLKRQSVFIGTTNESTYLKDKTGNRRYWPVAVGQCDFAGLTEARDQLFAEAFSIWENFGEPLYLNNKVSKHQAEEIQSDRVSEDEETLMAESFDDFYVKETQKNGDSNFNFNSFPMKALFEDFGPFKDLKPQGMPLQWATKILRSRGFDRFRSSGNNKWRKVNGH